MCFVPLFYGKRIASHSRYCDVEQLCKTRWHSCFFLFDVRTLFDLVWTFVRGWDMVCFRQLYTSIHLTMTMWWVPWLHIRWDHWGEQLFCTCCLKHWFLISFFLNSSLILQHLWYLAGKMQRKKKQMWQFCIYFWLFKSLSLFWCCDSCSPWWSYGISTFSLTAE